MLRRMMLAGSVIAAVIGGVTTMSQAQVSVDIGLHLGSPPPLVAVPNSPVMYAPSVNGNFFFYQRGYFVFRSGAWYMAPRHDGPWMLVAPEFVPRPLLVVPVRYYRVPPPEKEALACRGGTSLAAGLWTALGGAPRSRARRASVSASR